MESTDRFNSIKDYKLKNLFDYNNINIHINECNLKHCPDLVPILKNKIDQSEIIKYSSLQSNTHLRLLDNISSYLYINNIIVKLLSNDYLNILYGYINKDKIYNCF
jgi:hypothetical protein